MTVLVDIVAPAPATNAVTLWQQFSEEAPLSLALQLSFVYTSGGSSIQAWIQTSYDGGATASDIANFTVTTTPTRNILNLTQAAITSFASLTDGASTANASSGAPIGPLIRVKYTVTGTFAAGTVFRVDAAPVGARLTTVS